jgi:hypothetical protein
VAAAAAAVGEHDRARELAADAEQIAWSITRPSDQARAYALAGMALAAAAVGQHDRAERLARSITSPDHRAEALAAGASGVAGAGDDDRARELAADAERVAGPSPARTTRRRP